MSGRVQQTESSEHCRRALPEHGADVQQLHRDPGEPGNHTHHGQARSVLSQGTMSCLFTGYTNNLLSSNIHTQCSQDNST